MSIPFNSHPLQTKVVITVLRTFVDAFGVIFLKIFFCVCVFFSISLTTRRALGIDLFLFLLTNRPFALIYIFVLFNVLICKHHFISNYLAVIALLLHKANVGSLIFSQSCLLLHYYFPNNYLTVGLLLHLWPASVASLSLLELLSKTFKFCILLMPILDSISFNSPDVWYLILKRCLYVPALFPAWLITLAVYSVLPMLVNVIVRLRLIAHDVVWFGLTVYSRILLIFLSLFQSLSFSLWSYCFDYSWSYCFDS